MTGDGEGDEWLGWGGGEEGGEEVGEGGGRKIVCGHK